MARFFIDRPVLAWVIAIVIMLAGLLALFTLPVSQYPTIAPPTIAINAMYPGASAATLQDTVTQVIEQRMTGIDGLRYMKSTSDATGMATVTLTFEAGTDPDIAQVQVQNKLSLAIPVLPQEVQRQGVQVNKAASAFLMVLSLVAENPDITDADLSDYVVTNIQDPLSRVPGVGELQVFGGAYAMRIWLDPERLRQFALAPADVRAAIVAQNAQVSAGELGGAPAVPGQQLNATITAQTRLQTAEQFRQILLRTTADGAVVRLGDVARVELGAEQYNFVPRFNGKPSSGVGVRLASGANALDTAERVRAEMDRLAQSFPEGMSWLVPYDTTPFVRLSIEGVVHTLIEAIILVFLVMYLFLQNLRATLIPTIAVPVVLLGTFGVLAAAGFSVNTLTMFAMVLAIGLLVDDAIVVVENVERIMEEEGLSPLEATRKSMDQITGALVGIAMVLAAVFVPMAFFGGSTGVIYRQFSITIVAAMALSVLVAIILTPALCAVLLRPVSAGSRNRSRGFFGWFNRGFERGTHGYHAVVSRLVVRGGRMLLVYLAIVVAVVLGFGRLPTSFLPDEDQGILLTQVQLPAGATQEQALAALDQVQSTFLDGEKDAVASVFTVAGFSFAGTGQNMGLGFVRLHPWEERPGTALRAQEVAGRTMAALGGIRNALAFAFAPPPIPELGVATGFDFFLQDRAGVGREALVAARNQFLALAAQDPNLVGVRPNGQPDTPQYHIEVDSAAAGALGLTMAEVNDTLSTAWGGAYVNDFIDKGRVKKVFVQADAPFRMLPEDLGRWYVRSGTGEMVPFSAFARAQWTAGASRLERYNGLPALEILGQAAPGRSTGEAMAAVERIVAQLPSGIDIAWTGLSYEEREAGAHAPLLYALSLLVVFLCLAALYESWSIPFSVMLIVPLGILGAVFASVARGMSNDIYFQVALLATVGLSAKNAILIVEFAREQVQQGTELIAATLVAARQRLRPIVMTSLAFALGVLPLAVSTGAGSGSQNAIGTGVLGGTIAGTLLGLFFVPVFFVIVSRVFGRRSEPAASAPTSTETPGES